MQFTINDNIGSYKDYVMRSMARSCDTLRIYQIVVHVKNNRYSSRYWEMWPGIQDLIEILPGTICGGCSIFGSSQLRSRMRAKNQTYQQVKQPVIFLKTGISGKTEILFSYLTPTTCPVFFNWPKRICSTEILRYACAFHMFGQQVVENNLLKNTFISYHRRNHSKLIHGAESSWNDTGILTPISENNSANGCSASHWTPDSDAPIVTEPFPGADAFSVMAAGPARGLLQSRGNPSPSKSPMPKGSSANAIRLKNSSPIFNLLPTPTRLLPI